MGRLVDDNLIGKAGSRITDSAAIVKRVQTAITGMKTDMMALRAQINASVAAGDGTFIAADQTEVNDAIQQFKSDLTTFIAAL